MPSYDDRMALIVVDVQNDFADPNGSLFVREGDQVIPVANEEIGRAVQRGSVVVYTQDWHPEHTPHFQVDGGIWPVHCVQGTWGAQFHPQLTVLGEIVQKGSGGEDGYSGFTMRDPVSGTQSDTRLEGLLRGRRVQRVVVVGLATDYCVKETALDSVGRGFDTTVVAEGIRAVDLQPGDGERALQALRQAGARIE